MPDRDATAEKDGVPGGNRCGWDLCGDPHHRAIPPQATALAKAWDEGHRQGYRERQFGSAETNPYRPDETCGLVGECCWGGADEGPACWNIGACGCKVISHPPHLDPTTRG